MAAQDCPVCRNPLDPGADTCPRCLTNLKSDVRLPQAESEALLRDGFPFYAAGLDDATDIKDCLANSGIKVAAAPEDLARLGISLHDTHGYRLVVPRDQADEAFEILRKEVPHALFSELESGLGLDINEILTWPLNPDFRASLIPGITMEEFLERALGPEQAATVLQKREENSIGPEAVSPILKEAFASQDVDHDELFASLGPASSSAFEVLFDALLSACRACRDDLVWPIAKTVKRFRRDGLERRLLDLGPVVRAAEADVRRMGALALGVISDRRASHYLVELLGDADERVRYEAIDALFNLTGDDRGFVSDGTEAERARAVQRWQDWLSGE